MNHKNCANSELPFFKEECTSHQAELSLNGVPLRGIVRYRFEPRKGHRGILTVKLRIQHPMGIGTQEPEPSQRHNLRIEQEETGGYVLYLDDLRLQRGVMEFHVKAYESEYGSVAVLVLLVQTQGHS